MKIFLILCLICALSGCGENDSDETKSLLNPVDLIPRDDEISGWARLGTYDEANDYDSLYAIIDGGAQIFIDNGFISAVFQQYNCISSGSECPTALVTLHIYDQGSEENAQKVYDRTATGIGTPWSGAGVEARIDESAIASYTIEFWHKNFFIQVIIDEKSDEALNVAKLFASYISGKIRR